MNKELRWFELTRGFMIVFFCRFRGNGMKEFVIKGSTRFVLLFFKQQSMHSFLGLYANDVLYANFH